MPQNTGNLSINVQGSGPALVLLHGWGLNQAIWHPIQAKLAAHFTVYCVDLPGFGDSSWLPGNESFHHACTRVAEQLIRRIGHSFALAGWSMGGLIATQIALDFPTYVQRLITIASSPCFIAHEGEQWPGIKPTTLETFRYQLTTDYRKTLERFLAVQALGSPAARDEIKAMRVLLSERAEPQPEALVAGLRWLAQVDMRKQLTALQVPLLRLYGKRDSLVPIATQEAIRPLLPHHLQDTVVTFQGSAHAPFFTEPEQFVAALL